MKRVLTAASILALLLVSSTAAVGGGPELTNYQGYLQDEGGNPLQGLHDVTFGIHADATDLTVALWSETHAVDVTDGLFNVILGSVTNFPSDLFDTEPRWMSIRVDGGPHVLPVMRMTSVPWAIRANVADVALSTPGGADSDWIVEPTGSDMYSGVPGNVGIGTTTPRRKLEITGGNQENGVRLWWGPAYSSLFGDLLHAGSGGFRINSHAGGGTWADLHLQTNAETRLFIESRGDVGIGTISPQQKLDVAGTIQTQGFKMSSGAASGWVLTCNAAGDATWQPAGGTTGDGDWTIDGTNMFSSVPGKLGIGTTAYRGKISVQSVGDTGIHVYTDSEDAVFSSNSAAETSARLSGPGYGVLATVTARSGTALKGVNNQGFAVYGESDSVAVHGVNLGTAGTVGELGSDDYGVHGTYGSRTEGHLAGNYYGAYGTHIDSGNYGYLGGNTVGVYGRAPEGTGVYGASTNGIAISALGDNNTAVQGFTFNGTAFVGVHASSNNEGRMGNVDWGVYGYSGDDIGVKGHSPLGWGVFGTSDSGTAVYGRSGTGSAGHFDGDVLVENGRVRTPVLQITGGADLSEQFDVQTTSGGAPPEPGMVVCVDRDRPGGLVVSGSAYDKRVAGVISGAGGVQPGMLMGQAGTDADGATPVALTGRVYCWVDASSAPVEPGDLLTTSDRPGHAMKASDRERSHGAIIGKAMSALDSGQGLVLVLVNLQ